ncbi:hypothetical protein [Streptomyces clavuligerus]|uniref:Putative secreted protein n=1 Tax=Streptomyces clavuligerus TaxID=1901 RepID=D5SM09_STRCL|nr:hypothetical protein [Streptomyces clavuligerus]EFG04952.1 putative secreted protein [Streptomyces clavuligerus]MBY6306615.1 hypothetical protein [Streptomyces clavuligerus]QCS10777.1 hypothetical protein CRV15_35260 [Streptomyces clavuligerus]QPJ97189.1 hypothetical protein GE265_29225 [Streptomyces clavuligerus]WDN57486.1 hypothetical protein LL058_37620 [Streptomyces clavuligerus]
MDLDDRILDYARRPEGRSGYRPPNEEQREDLARGVGHLIDGDAGKAEKVLGDAGFRVTRLTDTDSGRRYDEVAARSSDGRAARWGRLYLNADAAVRWSVQVPHPVTDRNTEALGSRLLESTPGGALVLAGAHRTAGRGDTADVAHRTDSVFHAVVTELQKRNVPGVQLHGFAESSKRPYDAILSTGAMQTAPGEATLLADLMENSGLRVCRGWSDQCPLEGVTNVQGREAQRRQSTFLHVELAPRARGGGNDAPEARAALIGLLESWNSRA